jgi:hypothetical protein
MSGWTVVPGVAGRAPRCAVGSVGAAWFQRCSSPSCAWPGTRFSHPTATARGLRWPRLHLHLRHQRRRRTRNLERRPIQRRQGPRVVRLRPIGVLQLVRQSSERVTIWQLGSTTGARTPRIPAGVRRHWRRVNHARWESTPERSALTTPSCATSWPTSSATRMAFVTSRPQTTALRISGSRIPISVDDPPMRSPDILLRDQFSGPSLT